MSSSLLLCVCLYVHMFVCVYVCVCVCVCVCLCVCVLNIKKKRLQSVRIPFKKAHIHRAALWNVRVYAKDKDRGHVYACAYIHVYLLCLQASQQTIKHHKKTKIWSFFRVMHATWCTSLSGLHDQGVFLDIMRMSDSACWRAWLIHVGAKNLESMGILGWMMPLLSQNCVKAAMKSPLDLCHDHESDCLLLMDVLLGTWKNSWKTSIRNRNMSFNKKKMGIFHVRMCCHCTRRGRIHGLDRTCHLSGRMSSVLQASWFPAFGPGSQCCWPPSSPLIPGAVCMYGIQIHSEPKLQKEESAEKNRCFPLHCPLCLGQTLFRISWNRSVARTLLLILASYIQIFSGRYTTGFLITLHACQFLQVRLSFSCDLILASYPFRCWKGFAWPQGGAIYLLLWRISSSGHLEELFPQGWRSSTILRNFFHFPRFVSLERLVASGHATARA
jgi:hypothetical protein